MTQILPQKSSFGILLVMLAVFFGLFIPLSAWFGWYDSAEQMQFLTTASFGSYDLFAACLATSLVLIPIAWMVTSRVVDTAALVIIQNALMFFGFFFLAESTERLGVVAQDTMRTAPFMLLINAVGFTALLGCLGATYLFVGAHHAGRRISPAAVLPPPRYIWLLRGVAAVACGFIALPMAIAHTIPMLAADPSAARFAIVQAGGPRALYHLGTAMVPIAGGGLVIIILRSWRRFFGIDGFLLLSMIGLQIVTSNRLPLSNMLVMMVALLTLAKRWTRIGILLFVCFYLMTFMGLSGLSGLLRSQDTNVAGGGVLQESFRAAFVGDNLIDLRDGAWVFSQWDHRPLMGKTYLGGLASFMPSAIFPEKKAWHLGMNTVRIVGWEDRDHFGIRVSFFGESFLNFGWAGVVGLGVFLGTILGYLLKTVHLRRRAGILSLYDSLRLMILMEMFISLCNTGDAFIFWSMAGFLLIQRLVIGGAARRFGESPTPFPVSLRTDA